MSIQNVNPTDTERALGPDQAADRGRLERGPRKGPDMLDFSLLFFANRESVDPAGEYGLLLDSGQFAEIKTFPRPVQRELDLWMTCSSNPRTFVEAGLRG